MSSSPEAVRAALDVLKGQENPFECLARPQRMDDNFLDLHVPELLARERKLLLQIIDRYRVQEYGRAADMPATRVVTILGDRGSGKTHLLQSLFYREDGRSQIMVRPSYYDASLAFEEYLLSQLVAGLTVEDASRPIEDIAAVVTRRLLRQTLQSLGPTERIFALDPGRLRRWRLLFGGGERAYRVFDSLAEALSSPETSRHLDELFENHRLSPALCFRLLRGHLQRLEIGKGPLPVLRRELYSVMARAVFFKDTEPLFAFLEGEYTQYAGASTRYDMVNRMLHAMTEVCAIVRQPIVFAFDNLERLFSPQNRFDGELARMYWNALAQAVDNTRGLLILLFAEHGLFEKVASYMDSFARDRISQGVPIYAQGPVSEIRLRPPSSAEIRALLHSRVRRLSLPAADELPEIFPFDEGFLRKDAADGQNLRITLTRLRDEYSRVVYQQTPVQQPPQPKQIEWEPILEARWQEHLAAAGRLVTGSMAPQLQKLHAGLGSVLRHVLPLRVDGRELVEVQPTVSIGDTATYGVATLLHWRLAGVADDSAAWKVGVGFLLGKGKGMSTDLQAKFSFFQRPARGSDLLILWPATRDADDLVAILPPATRSVWDDSRHNKKTTLRYVTPSDLGILLAFPDWLNAVQTLREEPPPQDVLAAFVKDRLQSILQMVAPPIPAREKVLIDED